MLKLLCTQCIIVVELFGNLRFTYTYIKYAYYRFVDIILIMYSNFNFNFLFLKKYHHVLRRKNRCT